MKTILDENPSKEDVKLIYNGLMEFNTLIAGPPDSKPFAVLLRNPENDQVTGGLYAALFYGWAYVMVLFVPGDIRRRGFGLKLLGEVDAYARAKGCRGIWLDTYSFQAPGFYEKAGFEKFGELPDFPPGHSRVFYRKIF